MACGSCGRRYRGQRSVPSVSGARAVTVPSTTSVHRQRRTSRGVMKKQMPVVQPQQDKPIATPERVVTFNDATPEAQTKCHETLIPSGLKPLSVTEMESKTEDAIEGGEENE